MPDSTTKATESRSERVRSLRKARARSAVADALERGVLVRPGNCENCHRPAKVHGHHDDYSRPLEVRWLCPKCHSGWHVDNGPGDSDVSAPVGACLNCGHQLPDGSRRDKKYCNNKCRRQAFERIRNSATVFRTTRLKSGKISVVLHLEYPTLRPGDRIRWVRD